jgi:hypothetical protein
VSLNFDKIVADAIDGIGACFGERVRKRLVE